MTSYNHIADNCYEEEEIDALEREEETLLFFSGLLRRDEGERAGFMDHLDKSLKLWISRPEDLKAQKLLSVHLPTVLRLSLNAPFVDVRTRMEKMLRELEKSGHKVPHARFVGPSSFIPPKESVSYYQCCAGDSSGLMAVQSFYEEAFMYNCRLPHLVQTCGYHPAYIACLVRTHDFLMNGDGPLPFYIRNYLAILAASRHKCSYLVTIQEIDFVKNGGDIRWLQGLQHVPQKILDLLVVNKMVAHQPWLLKPDHMKALLRGADSWSLAELVQALVIFAHFHVLAGFALGCGVNPELDTPMGYAMSSSDKDTIQTPLDGNPALGMGGTPSDSVDSEPASPMDKLPSRRDSPPHPEIATSRIQHYLESAEEDGQQKSLVETLKIVLAAKSDESVEEETAEDQDQQFAETLSSHGMSNKAKVPVATPINLVKYIDDAAFGHEDFNFSAAITLRARDYSWDDHGFPFLNSLYPDAGQSLDDKFQVAFNLTYRTVGKERNMDTAPFREAVWYYIHSIKGIRHDDYQYKKVNDILEIQFKTYIRMVACFPEKVTYYDYINAMKGLEHSEKVHVNFLVLEARLQAELIYALRAVMQYMKQ